MVTPIGSSVVTGQSQPDIHSCGPRPGPIPAPAACHSHWAFVESFASNARIKRHTHPELKPLTCSQADFRGAGARVEL